jgi:pimeloyl-ACP methyl ester carboxylesterase
MLAFMPRAKSNGLELEYDTFGDPADPALILVMGLGAQMISWEADFCRLLAGEGFHVVRFDNRDIGLSTYLDEWRATTQRCRTSCQTWPMTPPACSTRWKSLRPISSVRRWGA